MNIAIIGAGPLGGTLAHLIAHRDLARVVCVVDEAGQVAAGKALDIMQTAPIERFACAVSGSADITMAATAHIVVLADDAGGAVWEEDAGIAQLTRLVRLAAGRPVICAGAGHRTIVERGVRDLGFSRHHLFGSAPEALTAAVRAMVALEANLSPRDVSLLALGIPPSQVVIPWEAAAVGGRAAVHALDEPSRRRLAARIPTLWPPGPLALAAAAAHAVAGLTGAFRGSLTAFVAPDDTLGRKSRAAAWPVTLGPAGVTAVLTPSLSGHQRTALDTATLL